MSHQTGIRNTELGFGVDEISREVRERTAGSPVSELRTEPRGVNRGLKSGHRLGCRHEDHSKELGN